MNSKTIARINDVNIIYFNDGEREIPIKPICDILGISHQKQIEKIKNDEILSSTVTLRVTVAADGKRREMTCIPYMFIFGWLFSINPKNVSQDAQGRVVKYKLDCYKILFSHFSSQSKYLDEKQKAIDIQLEEVKKLRKDFRETKSNLNKAEKDLDSIMKQSFDDWKGNNMQMKIPGWQ